MQLQADLRSVAILIASLDVPNAARLFTDLPREAQGEVERLILSFSTIDPTEQLETFQEFLYSDTESKLCVQQSDTLEAKALVATGKTESTIQNASVQAIADQLDQCDLTAMREILNAIQSTTLSILVRAIGLDSKTTCEVDNAHEPESDKAKVKLDREFPLQEFTCPGRIEDLDDDSLIAALSRVDRATAVLALATASKSLIDRILDQLPLREARFMRHELDHLAAIRFADVEAAQTKVVCIANQQSDSLSPHP